jgi:hypothetical protein
VHNDTPFSGVRMEESGRLEAELLVLALKTHDKAKLLVLLEVSWDQEERLLHSSSSKSSEYVIELNEIKCWKVKGHFRGVMGRR